MAGASSSDHWGGMKPVSAISKKSSAVSRSQARQRWVLLPETRHAHHDQCAGVCAVSSSTKMLYGPALGGIHKPDRLASWNERWVGGAGLRPSSTAVKSRAFRTRYLEQTFRWQAVERRQGRSGVTRARMARRAHAATPHPAPCRSMADNRGEEIRERLSGHRYRRPSARSPKQRRQGAN